MSKFDINMYQIFFIGLFFLIAIVFFVFFAIQRGGNPEGAGGELVSITIWGTLSPENFEETFIDLELNSNIIVNYVFKDENSFESEFKSAVAEGVQPDLVLLPHELILSNQRILTIIPFESFPESDFKNQFLPATQILLTNSGILGIPVSVDPLVAFYNRDILQSSFTVDFPSNWNDFIVNIVNRSTKRNDNVITQASVGIGGVQNIENAKEILSTLFLQSENEIISPEGISTLYKGIDEQSVSRNVLEFYSQFSDPTKATYTWNSALARDRSLFLSGQLLVYFGFSSEYTSLTRSQPNLDIGVALIPQLDDSLKKTFGRVYAFALPRQPNNLQAAITSASTIVGAYAQKEQSVPPAVGSAYVRLPFDDIANANYRSAIIADNWLDANPVLTNIYFRNMLDSLISGRLSASESLTLLDSQLDGLFVRSE